MYFTTDRVAGSSWLLANMNEFGAEAPMFEPQAKRIFAVQSAAFGEASWWSDGQPSAVHYLDQIPTNARTDIASGACNLLFDVSNEGQPLLTEWFAALKRDLLVAGIPLERTIFLQQNRSLERDYHDWVGPTGEPSMTIMTYDHFARRMIGLLAQGEPDHHLPRAQRSRRFTCLNYMPRPGRTSFVSWLVGKGYAAAGYLSFAGFEIAKWNNDTPVMYEWFPDAEVMKAGFEELLHRVPLQLDLDVGDNRIPEYDVGPIDAYNDSYFSIVTESEQSSGELERITEKVIKPMAMMHPFVVVGNPNSLALLRQYGFRTFDGFLDETYDTILDPRERMRLVLEQVERLLTMPIDELHIRFINLRETLLYNALHARKLLNQQFRRVIEPNLLERIALV